VRVRPRHEHGIARKSVAHPVLLPRELPVFEIARLHRIVVNRQQQIGTACCGRAGAQITPRNHHDGDATRFERIPHCLDQSLIEPKFGYTSRAGGARNYLPQHCNKGFVGSKAYPPLSQVFPTAQCVMPVSRRLPRRKIRLAFRPVPAALPCADTSPAPPVWCASIDCNGRWRGTASLRGHHVECIHMDQPDGAIIVKWRPVPRAASMITVGYRYL
jgi:hypothetical protein